MTHTPTQTQVDLWGNVRKAWAFPSPYSCHFKYWLKDQQDVMTLIRICFVFINARTLPDEITQREMSFRRTNMPYLYLVFYMQLIKQTCPRLKYFLFAFLLTFSTSLWDSLRLPSLGKFPSFSSLVLVFRRRIAPVSNHHCWD